MKKRSKVGDYKKHLIEKQRLQYQYNISERQMRLYITKAMHQAGNPEDRLFGMLETESRYLYPATCRW